MVLNRPVELARLTGSLHSNLGTFVAENVSNYRVWNAFRKLSQMSNPLQSVSLVVAIALMGAQTGWNDSPDKRSQQPLEIRVVRPVKWVNRCLALSIDRVNRSTAPLFLPFNGLLIESSVLEITDDAAKGPQGGWLPAYWGLRHNH
jgi:hypothetical protein